MILPCIKRALLEHSFYIQCRHAVGFKPKMLLEGDNGLLAEDKL